MCLMRSFDRARTKSVQFPDFPSPKKDGRPNTTLGPIQQHGPLPLGQPVLPQAPDTHYNMPFSQTRKPSQSHTNGHRSIERKMHYSRCASNFSKEGNPGRKQATDFTKSKSNHLAHNFWQPAPRWAPSNSLCRS